MKKLLVVLMAAMLVLSVAVVSMAAVDVKGDFRLEWIQDSSKADQAKITDNPDFRLSFGGKVSDTTEAFLKLRWKGDAGQVTVTDTDTDSTLLVDESTSWNVGTVYADEFWFKSKFGWGTVTVGNWDWKTTPSRVNLKSENFNVFPRTEATVAVDVPFGEAVYAGLAYALDGAKSGAVKDGAYDLKLGYKVDAFGVEFHTAVTDPDTDGKEYTSFDAFYNVTENIKLAAYSNQIKDTDADPVIGATFANIAGSKVKATLEYAIDKEANGRNFNPYYLTVIVPLTGGMSWEVEYNNISADDNKLLGRLRAQF